MGGKATEPGGGSERGGAGGAAGEVSAPSEMQRLREDAAGVRRWKGWGPYLSERQWGTVREDYSADGSAWDYFPHDHARSRAYRWGEDGIAGFSDDRQRLCMSVALWNGKDPILKERLFGVTNSEGNHGEDVKELYYFLDATPTHSYLKMLYKYPQAEYPYARLLEESRRRGKEDAEFEIADTGVFDGGRYFDVFVEYARERPDDMLMCVTVHNRGPEEAEVHVLPQLWFRNTWSWEAGSPRPLVALMPGGWVSAMCGELGDFVYEADGAGEVLFCENETNGPRLYGVSERGRYYKDGIHERVVRGDEGATNPARRGTKAAAWFRARVPAGGSRRFRVRLRGGNAPAGFGDFDGVLERARRSADEYYEGLQAEVTDEDARRVQRQAFAGLIWSKQVYLYDAERWLKGDPAQPRPPSRRRHGRNSA